jgi:hypothetical protein
MSQRTDLSRWNRAGLSTFRYVRGNAATYLEELRLALREHFDGGEWTNLEVTIPDDETDSARVERLLEQYEGERQDWGWEIARSLARSCHVLAGYADAYANEGFLGTATQWDNVRRLVAMLDYHPAPPASASTRLVLEAKEDQDPGTVETGFQVKHSPPDGGKAVIFETLSDLEVDSKLNALRLAGWNRSVQPLVRQGKLVKSPVGRRSAIDLQGVGEVYAARLNQYKRSREAEIGTIFADGGFAGLDRLVGAVGISGLPWAFDKGLARGIDFYSVERSLDSVFTIADFVELDPDATQVEILPVHLWEFKKKAELLLSVNIDPTKMASILNMSAADVAAMSLDELESRTSRPREELEELKDELRKVQIALDEPAFNDNSLERRFLLRLGRDVEVELPAVRLRDLVGGIAEAPDAPWIKPDDAKISAGDLGVVVRESGIPEGAVVHVEEVDADSGELTLKDAPEQLDWRPWARGRSSLLVGPRFIERPHLNGTGALTFKEAHGLSVGEVIAWEKSTKKSTTWVFATVEETDELALRLAGKATPPAGTDVYQALEIERGDDELAFPAEYEAAARPDGTGFSLIKTADYKEVRAESDRETPDEPFYHSLKDTDVHRIYLVPDGAETVGRTIATTAGDYTFDGSPGKLAGGQWVVADDSRRLWPLEIASITELEKTFIVRFTAAGTPLPPVATLPVEVVQGIGSRYGGRLRNRGIRTLAELSALEVSSFPHTISRVRIWEFKTKAELIVGFAGNATTLEPVLGLTLADVVKKPDAELADLLGSLESEAREIKDGLRLIEAVIDQPTFRAKRVGDLLPAGGATSGGDETILDRLDRLYGDFEHTLRPQGWDRNLTPLTGTELTLDPKSVDALPSLLERGRKLILEQESGDDFTGAVEVDILTVTNESLTITVTPELTAEDGFTLGNTVVRGNVASAGHGETKPEKVLGSGDATRPNPSFVLEVEEVSFVADATQPSGVRADIAVKVDGQKWLQVANLRDSEPADPSYTVRMTEEGYVRIGFGDGRHGRRLPSGTNNVRVTYRVGAGLAQNLDAESLDKAVRPHYLVASVRQPLGATGGGDMEGVDSLRENAPASLLTLDRAVSLADFTHLAARQSSVWQARAFSSSTVSNRQERVEVVIVPAGGGELGDLERSLGSFLNAHAIPGVGVKVSRYLPVPFDLVVTVRVDPNQYEPDDVLESVRKALTDAFSLERRKLGQDLFLSDVFQVVEETTGVENSTCIINNEDSLRRLEASDRQVIYLDSTSSRLELIYERYRP